MTPKNAVKPTGLWTFFCNPKYWSVDEFLKNLKEGGKGKYCIKSSQKDFFKPRQLGVIRVGSDSRSVEELKGNTRLERGVYAVVEITSEAYFVPPNSDSPNDPKSKSSVRYFVDLRYIRNYINSPVLLEDLQYDFFVKQDPYFLEGYQAATMPLKEDAFNRILLYGEEARCKVNEAVFAD